ncbi:MAG: site-specific integrase [Bacteriovoracaceae bacterium]|jgi:integrase|nr:site-specific integrase [Bacteriovoracaceae bacterium]
MAKPTKHYGKWRIRWSDERGCRKSESFDSKEDADFYLKKYEVEVEEIKRGIRKRNSLQLSAGKKRYTFNQTTEYWLKKKAHTKRSLKDDVSILRKHLSPFFGEYYLEEIGVETVDKFQIRLNSLKPKTVSNILTLLISILNLAKELEWIEKVPAIKKPKVDICSTDYKYLKTSGEVTNFLRSAKQVGEYNYTLYLMALSTGLRQGELAALVWSDIDFPNQVIRVNKSFRGPTKSGRSRVVPILDNLLNDLKAWRLKNPSSLIFPNQKGNMHSPGARVFKQHFKETLGIAGFESKKIGRKEVHYITFHGLRHTFASHWMMNGGDIFKLQKILGHQDISITMRYAHLSPNAFQSDLNRFDCFSAVSTLDNLISLQKK